jgi:hypothetical protein
VAPDSRQLKGNYAIEIIDCLSLESALEVIMHYLFLDESYSPGKGRKTIIMAAWLVEQARLNRYLSTSPDLHRTPVLNGINSMLESLDAWAAVACADLDEKLFRAGEIDGTDDIPSMARTDNIWSQCFIFVVGNLIAKLVYEGKDLGTVDIHFDPKSLKPDHAAAVGATLRNMLVQEAKRYASQLARLSGARLHLLKNLKIRRIEPVTKARNGQAPDKFQTGTWVADKLCSSYEIIRTRSFSRIVAIDMSEVVRKTVQQFDGKSFYK